MDWGSLRFQLEEIIVIIYKFSTLRIICWEERRSGLDNSRKLLVLYATRPAIRLPLTNTYMMQYVPILIT